MGGFPITLRQVNINYTKHIVVNKVAAPEMFPEARPCSILSVEGLTYYDLNINTNL